MNYPNVMLASSTFQLAAACAWCTRSFIYSAALLKYRLQGRSTIAVYIVHKCKIQRVKVDRHRTGNTSHAGQEFMAGHHNSSSSLDLRKQVHSATLGLTSPTLISKWLLGEK